MALSVLRAVTLGCLMVGSAAQASSVKLDMAPGLWLNTISYVENGEQVQAALDEMKKLMASMSEEQRKVMEQAMNASNIQFDDESVQIKNQGIALTSQGLTSQQCITQADIDEGLLSEVDEDCEVSLQQVGAKRFKHTQQCTDELSMTMQSEIEFLSKTHYKGTGVMTQEVNGQRQQTKMTLEGKWLSASCE